MNSSFGSAHAGVSSQQSPGRRERPRLAAAGLRCMSSFLKPAARERARDPDSPANRVPFTREDLHRRRSAPTPPPPSQLETAIVESPDSDTHSYEREQMYSLAGKTALTANVCAALESFPDIMPEPESESDRVRHKKVKGPSRSRRSLSRLNEKPVVTDVNNDEVQTASSLNSITSPLQKMQLSAVCEYQLKWMKDSATVINIRSNGLHMCAPLLFVPPASALMCAIEENEVGAARFCHISGLLREFFERSDWTPWQNADMEIGASCVVRMGEEYARAIYAGKSETSPSLLRFVCLDYHGLAEVGMDCVSRLPYQFQTQQLPCNTFLARVRGIERIPLRCTLAVSTYYGRTLPDCSDCEPYPTAIFKCDSRIDNCVADWIVDEEGYGGCWHSQLLLSRHKAVERTTDPSYPNLQQVLNSIKPAPDTSSVEECGRTETAAGQFSEAICEVLKSMSVADRGPIIHASTAFALLCMHSLNGCDKQEWSTTISRLNSLDK